MPRARSLALGAALVAGLGTAAVAGLAAVDFDSPELGRAVLDSAARRSGVGMEAESFRFNLLRGLEVRGLSSGGRRPAGKFELVADRVTFRHRLLPLLRGRVVIGEAAFEAPRLELVRHDQPSATSAAERRRRARTERREARRARRAERQSPPEAEPPAAAGRWQPTVEVAALRLENADLVLTDPGSDAPSTRLSGLDLELRDLRLAGGDRRPLLGLSATGRLAATELSTDRLTGRDAHGDVELSEGRVTLRALELTAESGRILVETLEVDLTEQPFRYRLELESDSLDSGVLLAAGTTPGLGTAALTFDGAGVGAESTGLEGEGRLTLHSGRLPELPLLSTLDRLLGRPLLVGAEYPEIAVPFGIRGNRVEIAGFTLPAGAATVELAGWVDREGPLSLRATVRAPRDRVAIADLPDRLLDGLTDEEGYVALPLVVSGSRDRPSVAPDLPEISREGRRKIEDALEETLREKLRELFGDA